MPANRSAAAAPLLLAVGRFTASVGRLTSFIERCNQPLLGFGDRRHRDLDGFLWVLRGKRFDNLAMDLAPPRIALVDQKRLFVNQPRFAQPLDHLYETVVVARLGDDQVEPEVELCLGGVVV